MFNKNKLSWTDQLKDKITKYVDELFEDYRGQLSIDLSRGLAALAGLIALWTLAIVCVVFVSITIALFIGWGLSFYLQKFAYILGFLLVAVVLLGIAYYIMRHKKKYIEQPVFHTMAKALRSPLEKENHSLHPEEAEVVPNENPSAALPIKTNPNTNDINN
jgi:hypothetical protein